MRRLLPVLLASLLPGCGCEPVPDTRAVPPKRTALAAPAAPLPAKPAAPVPPPRPELAPVPTAPGGADMTLDSFDGKAGEAPKGWRSGSGRWLLAEDASAARGPSVLKQDQETQPWAVLLKDGVYAGDLSLQARFKPVSGREDASGGLILRAQDAENYLLCRANALEGNFRLYAVKDGRRETLESADVQAPELGTWHTLQMSVAGDTVTCGLDGKTLLTRRLDASAWAKGRVGLWTKADSVTEFDDVQIVRVPATPGGKP